MNTATETSRAIKYFRLHVSHQLKLNVGSKLFLLRHIVPHACSFFRVRSIISSAGQVTVLRIFIHLCVIESELFTESLSKSWLFFPHYFSLVSPSSSPTVMALVQHL